jgi:hypothetical protein
MAAVTTVPGFGVRVLPTGRPGSSRLATRRGRGTSPATLRRRRIVAAVLALGVVVVAGQAGGALGGSPLAAPERRPTVSTETIVVRPGDTLWGIAQRLAPGEDPRPIVDELAAVHGPGPLVPGQTLSWAR